MKNTPIRKKFGQILREKRKSQGYSQESLAHDLDLHRTYIGSIERGEQSVSLDNINKIATKLNMTVSELLKDL